MIDAVKILKYYTEGLLEANGQDYGPHMNLMEVLEATEAEDNPILVVVHVKDV